MDGLRFGALPACSSNLWLETSYSIPKRGMPDAQLINQEGSKVEGKTWRRGLGSRWRSLGTCCRIVGRLARQGPLTPSFNLKVFPVNVCCQEFCLSGKYSKELKPKWIKSQLSERWVSSPFFLSLICRTSSTILASWNTSRTSSATGWFYFLSSLSCHWVCSDHEGPQWFDCSSNVNEQTWSCRKCSGSDLVGILRGVS